MPLHLNLLSCGTGCLETLQFATLGLPCIVPPRTIRTSPGKCGGQQSCLIHALLSASMLAESYENRGCTSVEASFQSSRTKKERTRNARPMFSAWKLRRPCLPEEGTEGPINLVGGHRLILFIEGSQVCPRVSFLTASVFRPCHWKFAIVMSSYIDFAFGIMPCRILQHNGGLARMPRTTFYHSFVE